jgi:hypothetical protein
VFVSDIWPYVTKQNPCGICGKPDWCQRGDRGWKCQRVESPHPFAKGGWFHPFGDSKPIGYDRPKSKLKIPTLDATKLISEWFEQTTDSDFEDLACALGVSLESVVALGAVKAFWRPGLWSLDKFPSRGWAFPMRSGDGTIVGIRVRSDDGKKWAVTGSHGGIFIPDATSQKLVFLCEGPTSTAAALTLGFYAIGRPSCNSGGEMIKDALKRIMAFKAVIVADNDAKPNGLQPGLTGALKLAKEIGIKSAIWTPPTKDIRDFLNSGGTKAMIDSDLKGFVFRNY